MKTFTLLPSLGLFCANNPVSPRQCREAGWEEKQKSSRFLIRNIQCKALRLLTPLQCALCELSLSTIFVLISSYPLTTLANENGINTGHKIEYNYNAVCMFMDFVLGFQLPKIDNRLLLDKKHVEKISAGNLERDIKHFEKPIQMYRYISDGVKADFVIKPSSGSFYTNAHFEANKVPEDMRTKKYLLSILQIRNIDETVNSILLGCDGSEMIFHFNGGELTTLDISTSLD